MTVLSRGARTRRSGRRPGWLLLTVLLVLAIAASSALVFTNRVELLKLAVILALWAAVVGAFVSVIYRRQSDADQAKVRDLKLVYDLQLDREISARREYELTVESHLRREIATELRAQAADEVAALRAELAALRTNLEILFDTDLAHRPAIETERAQSEWIRTPEPEWPVRSGRIASSRIPSLRDDDTTRTAESPIIDVPEEPLGPPPPPPQPPPQPRRRQRVEETDHRGSHRYAEEAGRVPPPPPQSRPAPAPAQPAPQPQPQPQPQPAPPPAAVPPPPPVAQPQPAPPPAAEPRQERRAGAWMPGPPPPETENGHAPGAEPPAPERRGRHSGSSEPALVPSRAPEPPPERRGRHSSQAGAPAPAMQAQPITPPAPPHEPTARHRSPDAEGPPSGALSAAELLARFQAEAGAGGRRRRRED